MMLSDEQLEFLSNEFSISLDDLEKMTKEQWFSIREKSFDIEVEEAMQTIEDDCDISDRGDIAASIADIKYNQLNA